MATSQDRGWLILEISDNGAGFPAHRHGRPSPPGVSTKGTGRGAGLAIVRSILDRYDGTLEFRPRTPRGTRVRVGIPKRPPAFDVDALVDRAALRHAPLRNLTPRQRQVLVDVLSGSSNKEIAERLGLSARTVEVHRRNLMRALRARSPLDLARMVFSPIP